MLRNRSLIFQTLTGRKRWISTKPTVIDLQDINFYLFQVLRIQENLFNPSFPRFENHSSDTVMESLASSSKIAEDYFSSHNRKNDLKEPSFDGKKVVVNSEVSTALKHFYHAGLGAAHADEDFGGLQLPSCVTNAMMIAFYSANIGTVTFPFLTIAAGNMLKKYGSQEQLKKYLVPMLEGRFFGTMNLSEPQAGSSLGDITTKAFPINGQKGKYLIRGTKMWISGGDHELSENIVHMVLAKVADPSDPTKILPGVKGISLFIVPKKRVSEDGTLGDFNDINLAGLNKKMGWRGATNCVLNYGENNACIGELMGEEGKGLSVMFNMMNEARISVGVIASALGYSGYAASFNYALERKQGRLLENKDPNSNPVAIIEHPDVKRMLLVQKSYVEGSLLLCLYASQLVDKTVHPSKSCRKELEDDAILLDLLTPIVKSWPSEWCLEANKWAIQILGGYGYTRDYSVEQTYRDNRLNMIHEGTNGIQSLDLLGRKMKTKGFQVLKERVSADIVDALKVGDKELDRRARELRISLERIEKVREVLVGEFSKLPSNIALANSHEFLNMCGSFVIAWMWLKQDKISARMLAEENCENQSFYQGKRMTSKYFFDHELPKTIHQTNLLLSLDRTTLDMNSEWF